MEKYIGLNQTKPKKGKCNERNLVKKKNTTINTKIYQHFEQQKRGEIKRREKYKVIKHK